MPGDATFTLVLKHPELGPNSRVQVRIDGRLPQDCVYEHGLDSWTVTGRYADHPEGLNFVFQLDGDDQLDGPITLSGPELRNPVACHFDNQSVRFACHNEIIVDSPAVAKRYFSADQCERRRYDFIIVGSGAGGGTLAYHLTRISEGKKNPPQILVLEAGSYLFGTHTGNLPRLESSSPDEYHPSLFEGWRTFGLRRWRAPDTQSSKAQIAQGMNFGGRSIFWGACAPRMKRWEFRNWPWRVADTLQEHWYSRAERLMRVAPLASSPYQDAVRARMGKVPTLAGFQHNGAPMAIEYTSPAQGAIPAGIWSTAELLFGLAVQGDRFRNLHVNLNNEVVRLDHAGQDVSSVVAFDHSLGHERIYELAPGGRVVLAAGTVNTPHIAKLSGLRDPAGLVGRGITDHPIRVAKFWVPKRSEWFTRFHSSKTLSFDLENESRDQSETPIHPYNMMLELGANLNQFRFTNPTDFTSGDLATTNDRMPGELVFLAETPLVEANHVSLAGTCSNEARSSTLPTVRIHPSPLATHIEPAVDKISSEVVSSFDGELYEELWAPLGGVSHEVGTMRMGQYGPDTGSHGVGVVDEDLRMRCYGNLFVCDLSIFPSSPAANPTLTLVALALRLAEHISE